MKITDLDDDLRGSLHDKVRDRQTDRMCLYGRTHAITCEGVYKQTNEKM